MAIVYGMMGGLHIRGYKESTFIVGKPGPIERKKGKKIGEKNLKQLFIFSSLWQLILCINLESVFG